MATNDALRANPQSEIWGRGRELIPSGVEILFGAGSGSGFERPNQTLEYGVKTRKTVS
jgi:hypothetical protein